MQQHLVKRPGPMVKIKEHSGEDTCSDETAITKQHKELQNEAL